MTIAVPRRGPALTVLLAVVAGVAGCSTADDKPPRHPVKGTVAYNGKPLKGAVVTFWPVPVDKADWKAVKPTAMAEADGSFQPNSYDRHDGAVAGRYAVTVHWTGEANGLGPDLLGGRYSDPNKPVLTVDIGAGENVLPPIDLKGPPVSPAGKRGDGPPL